MNKDYPPILTRLIEQVMAKGKNEKAATEIAISALQKSGNLYAGTTKATPKGVERGLMSPEERARDRDVLSKGKDPSNYFYDPVTNKMKRWPKW